MPDNRKIEGGRDLSERMTPEDPRIHPARDRPRAAVSAGAITMVAPHSPDSGRRGAGAVLYQTLISDASGFGALGTAKLTGMEDKSVS